MGISANCLSKGNGSIDRCIDYLALIAKGRLPMNLRPTFPSNSERLKMGNYAFSLPEGCVHEEKQTLQRIICEDSFIIWDQNQRNTPIAERDVSRSFMQMKRALFDSDPSYTDVKLSESMCRFDDRPVGICANFTMKVQEGEEWISIQNTMTLVEYGDSVYLLHCGHYGAGNPCSDLVFTEPK